MKVLYEDKAMTISWNEDDRIIESVWKGFATGEAYQNPLEKLLELVKSKKTSKILSDMRNMSAVSQSDQEWVEKDFMPRMIEAGIKYWALVFPTSVVATMSLKQMEQAVQEGIKPPFDQLNTDNIEEGRTWLKRQP